jgi:hypothetical protein
MPLTVDHQTVSSIASLSLEFNLLLAKTPSACGSLSDGNAIGALSRGRIQDEAFAIITDEAVCELAATAIT